MTGAKDSKYSPPQAACKESKSGFLGEDAEGTGGTVNGRRSVSCCKWSGQRSGS